MYCAPNCITHAIKSVWALLHFCETDCLSLCATILYLCLPGNTKAALLVPEQALPFH